MGHQLFQLAMIHLWQITIFGAGVWLVARLLGRRAPHFVVLLWTVFLVKCLIPPVMQSPVGVMAWLTPARVYSSSIDSASETLKTQTSNKPVLQKTGVNRKSKIPTSVDGANERSTEVKSTEATFYNDLLYVNFQAITAFWITGSIFLTCLFGFRYSVIARRVAHRELPSGVKPASIARAQTLLNSQLARLGMTRDSVGIVVSDHHSVPFVFGIRRATIVLPTELFDSGIDLEPILAHELCHLWRRDQILGWMQLFAQILFWFHPLVWVASRSINHWCEVSCDDDTIRIFTLKPTAYAKGLVDVLSLQPRLQPVHWVPSLRPAEITQQRISSVLQRGDKGLFRRTYHVAAAILLVIFVPSFSSQNWSVGIRESVAASSRSNDAAKGGDRQALRNLGFDMASKQALPSLAGDRSSFNFLIGQWDVFALMGSELTPAGRSIFTMEKSGKMIREEWADDDGASAQGITFYDPSMQQWRMTWVDSSGTIMDASGPWENQEARLSGLATLADGATRKIQVRLTHDSKDRFSSTLTGTDSSGVEQVLSRSTYHRVK